MQQISPNILKNWLDGIKQEEKAQDCIRQAQDLYKNVHVSIQKSNQAKQDAQKFSIVFGTKSKGTR